MCICSDRLAVQDCEMHYMNAWLKRCVFNLDLNRESVSEPRTLSGRLFHSLGARYEKVLPPLVDFAILGTTKSPEFCDLRERVGNSNSVDRAEAWSVNRLNNQVRRRISESRETVRVGATREGSQSRGTRHR